ncbi:MAG: hypothetical protein ACK52Z_10095 [Acidobacteriota bacterium]|jgi:hypothetical protein
MKAILLFLALLLTASSPRPIASPPLFTQVSRLLSATQLAIRLLQLHRPPRESCEYRQFLQDVRSLARDLGQTQNRS